jgi:DNA-binding transcriptional regulator YiaG
VKSTLYLLPSHFEGDIPSPRPPKVPWTAGDHLLKRRRDLGLTQAQVAKTLGVKVGTITSWEKNRQEPCGERLGGILRFLGYDPRAGSRPLSCR